MIGDYGPWIPLVAASPERGGSPWARNGTGAKSAGDSTRSVSKRTHLNQNRPLSETGGVGRSLWMTMSRKVVDLVIARKTVTKQSRDIGSL